MGDLGLLKSQQSQCFNNDSLPYPDSGTTTESATLERLLSLGIFSSRFQPLQQFQSQMKREKSCFIHQRNYKSEKQKQTLPYDIEFNICANAENNIQNNWIKQHIWKTEWGLTWLKSAIPSEIGWLFSLNRLKGPSPFGKWGHEKEQKSFPSSPNLIPESYPISSFSWQSYKMLKHTQAVMITAGLEMPETAFEFDVSAFHFIDQFHYKIIKKMQWFMNKFKYQ